jgi:hypothetical protein
MRMTLERIHVYKHFISLGAIVDGADHGDPTIGKIKERESFKR